nr:hypothetical protein BaRGS_013259 [Batillaria attramentaria]
MVNDDLGTRIACGSVTVKTDVKRVRSRAVEFYDGSVEEDVDVIILATGYAFGFPFIDSSVIDVKENKGSLKLPSRDVMWNDVRRKQEELKTPDPRLAMHVLFGPCTPYQYRLTGPGQWEGARAAILTQWERVVTHLRTRKLPSSDVKTTANFSMSLLTMVLLAVILIVAQQFLAWKA